MGRSVRSDIVLGVKGVFPSLASELPFRFGAKGTATTLFVRKTSTRTGPTGLVRGISDARVLRHIRKSLKLPDEEYYFRAALRFTAPFTLEDPTTAGALFAPLVSAVTHDRMDLTAFKLSYPRFDGTEVGIVDSDGNRRIRILGEEYEVCRNGHRTRSPKSLCRCGVVQTLCGGHDVAS